MTSLEAWQEANSRYLSAVVRYVRACLERALPPEPAASPAPPDRSIADANLEVEQCAAGEPIPALARLVHNLRLSRLERDVLFLCLANELDTRVATLCAQVQQEAARPFPTFGLALIIFPDVAWEALSPERPLRYLRLIEVIQVPGQPLTAAVLRTEETVVHYAKGMPVRDERVTPYLAAVGDTGGSLASSQQRLVGTIAALVRNAGARPVPPIQLLGTDLGAKRAIAAAVADELGSNLQTVRAEVLPTGGELEGLLRLFRRDATLLPLVLHLDAHGSDRGAESPSSTPAAALRLLDVLGGLRLVSSVDGLRGLTEGHSFEVQPPTAVEQREAWRRLLGDEAANLLPDELAGQFDLPLGAIERLAETATAQPETQDLRDRLWAACRDVARPRLDSLAQRIDPRVRWDDLVLPPEPTAQLRQIIEQNRHRHTVYHDWGMAERRSRGLGITALFAGASGTGKTMAAEVMAGELGLDLFRIDLSSVINKYIGETEKNLRRIFDAAEKGGALLFFDEADSLFGKRTEVRDSHDRYANIEASYLLVRMEEYRGVAILATNRKLALDPAFLRRLRFVVDFAFPDPDLRRTMWQRALPAHLLADEIDWSRLAKFDLTGGNINTIALNAAFSAAAAGGMIRMIDVLGAVRAELKKLQIPATDPRMRHLLAAEAVPS